jgi:hypothetical protein
MSSVMHNSHDDDLLVDLINVKVDAVREIFGTDYAYIFVSNGKGIWPFLQFDNGRFYGIGKTLFQARLLFFVPGLGGFNILTGLMEKCDGVGHN